MISIDQLDELISKHKIGRERGLNLLPFQLYSDGPFFKMATVRNWMQWVAAQNPTIVGGMPKPEDLLYIANDLLVSQEDKDLFIKDLEDEAKRFVIGLKLNEFIDLCFYDDMNRTHIDKTLLDVKQQNPLVNNKNKLIHISFLQYNQRVVSLIHTLIRAYKMDINSIYELTIPIALQLERACVNDRLIEAGKAAIAASDEYNSAYAEILQGKNLDTKA